MTLRYKIIISFILLIAGLLRFYNLDQIPPHLSNDEISIAYDAYSVSKTLRDEYGNFLPISFRSHNTYKAPLAIYLTIPTIKIFGNNEYGVRLPSAILGVLTVLFIGLLVFELSKNEALGLFTSFTLSITPWHVYCSRMALESNIALFFLVGGIYFFIKGLKDSRIWIVPLGFLFLAFSIYGYHTEWILTPLLIILLFFFSYRISLKKPIFLISFVFFIIIILPVFINALNNLHSYARFNTETILSDRGLETLLHSPKYNIVQKVLFITNAELGNYSQYMNPDYLFFDGLNLLPKSDPFQVGLFLSPFLLFFGVGLFKIKKYFGNNACFIYVWLLVSPLVPAFTIGELNLIRNLPTVIPLTLVIAVGGYEFWNYFKNKYFYILIFSFLIAISAFNFISIYYRNFPISSAEGFQYGYKQIALYIKQYSGNYEKIVIDPKFGKNYIFEGTPRLYIPYYTYFDPQKFFDERKDLPTGLYFDKYEIRSIVWSEEKITPLTLYVVPSSNTPNPESIGNLQMVMEIKLPNYDPAFVLYKSL